jgi:hypothetical protein
VSSVHAKIEHNFMLEGSFFKLTRVVDYLEERTASQYKTDDWHPGFGIACAYLMLPFDYLGVGARLSYSRAAHDVADVAFNAPGMILLVRPRFPFKTNVPIVAFGHGGFGVYKIIVKGVGGEEPLGIGGNSFLGFEAGGGVAIGAIEFGGIYHFANDRQHKPTMNWLSIFAAMRLALPTIRK